MNKENKIVPELRFPEFIESEKWNIEPLSELYSFVGTNSFTRDNLNCDEGLIKNIHYGDIHTKFSTLFDITKETVPFVNPSIPLEKIKLECYCKEGDMIFADASEDLADVGKSIEIIHLNNEKLLSGLHTLLARQKNSKLRIGFGGHLFLSPNIRTQIQNEAQGAKVLGISATRLSNINVFYPNDKAEQQKIADCLSSLDNLTNAQNQKLNALKDHKKGLMQLLFPAEGETVPKLRFKEFEKDGEWVEKTLGSVAEIVTGNTPSTLEIINYNGTRLFVSPVDIKDNRYITQTKTTLSDIGFSRTRKIKANSVLFVCIGSTIGKVAQNKFECATNQQLNSLIPNEGYSSDFLYSILEYNSTKIASIAGNHAVPIINKTSFSAIKLSFPSKTNEQQKIASCLSTLDDQITTQAQKIEALKEHKKGLMQGLFPNINE